MKFDILLHPVSPEEFFGRHWEKSPLIVSGRAGDYFSSLLSAADIDYLISAAATADASSVEAIRGTGEVERADPSRPDRVTSVYQSFKRGATVRVYSVQNYWKPIQAACRGLEDAFGARVRANLYCTPAGSQGAPRHYDTHEIFVLQIHGTKHWRVYEPVVKLPLETVPPLPFEGRGPELQHYRGGPRKSRSSIDEEESGPPVTEATLEPGDLLYLPRGFVHEAATSAVPSAHLTFGVHVLRWLDLMTVALAQLSNRDERLRRALPPGFLARGVKTSEMRETFRALADAFSGGADLEAAANEIAGSFIRHAQRVGDGTLFAACDADSVEADTVLVRRPGVLLSFIEEAGGCGLHSALESLVMPPAFAPALEYVARNDRFAVRDIPGGLSERSRLTLARRLVSAGFFTPAVD